MEPVTAEREREKKTAVRSLYTGPGQLFFCVFCYRDRIRVLLQMLFGCFFINNQIVMNK